METQEVRWKQRLEMYRKALGRLDEAVRIVSAEIIKGNELLLMKDGLIQRYEFTLELAWKLMKDFVEYEGLTEKAGGPRSVMRYGFQIGIIDDDRWVSMLEDRNLTSHAYDEMMAQEVVIKITNDYHPLLRKFEQAMSEREGRL